MPYYQDGSGKQRAVSVYGYKESINRRWQPPHHIPWLDPEHWQPARTAREASGEREQGAAASGTCRPSATSACSEGTSTLPPKLRYPSKAEAEAEVGRRLCHRWIKASGGLTRQVWLYPLHGPCEGPLAASPCSTPLQHSGPASSVPAALSLLLPTLLAHCAATPLPLRNNPPPPPPPLPLSRFQK